MSEDITFCSILTCRKYTCELHANNIRDHERWHSFRNFFGETDYCPLARKQEVKKRGQKGNAGAAATGK